nr:hypothetical protein [Microbacterium bovistercoris]
MNRAAAGPVVAGTALGAVTGFVLWGLGMSWPAGVAVALFGLAGGIAWAGFAGGDRPLYARTHAEPRPGTRSDMTQIAWSLRGRNGEISDSGVKRLRAFARARLGRHGLDLDDERDAAQIRVRLGPAGADPLLGGHVRSIAEVERCLDALEALEKTTADGPQTRATQGRG